jgi:hypothetical protein
VDFETINYRLINPTRNPAMDTALTGHSQSEFTEIGESPPATGPRASLVDMRSDVTDKGKCGIPKAMAQVRLDR